ncbi:predicted protein [Streptomyces iranensis]|uniref:Uncharacterized protein n=1 Tax=Streptomyces iranensis TaxID=576784 RepID=A0A060ZNS8_9ACTN|nr:predicted protein [Streptomyces iranensis]CDR05041.1 predicted protein [Streptomyces iranensis]
MGQAFLGVVGVQWYVGGAGFEYGEDCGDGVGGAGQGEGDAVFGSGAGLQE